MNTWPLPKELLMALCPNSADSCSFCLTSELLSLERGEQQVNFAKALY